MRMSPRRPSRYSSVIALIILTAISGLAITATTAGAAGVRFGFVDSVASWFGGGSTVNVVAEPQPTPESEAPNVDTTLLAWDTTGLSGTLAPTLLASTTTSADLASSNLTRGPGIGAAPLANGFSSDGYQATLIDTDYFQITVTPISGRSVSLSSISANFRRSGTGPNTFQWQYSLDGFATAGVNIGAAISYTGTETNGLAQTAVNLTAISALQNVASPGVITFRLLGYGATAAGGTFAIGRLAGDDLALVGSTATLAPEIKVDSPFSVTQESGSTVNLGSIALGQPISRDFFVVNTGTANLDVSAVGVSGGNASEFVVNPNGAVPFTLIPNQGRTVNVTFTPPLVTGGGLRSTTLSIANTDSDENPYLLTLQGTGIVPSSATDHFRSVGTGGGNWGTAATWETSPTGSDPWIPATLTPTDAANTITVRSPDNVTVAASVSADQLTVNSGASVTIGNAQTLTIADGTGTDLTNDGVVSIGSTTATLTNNGSFANNGLLLFQNGTSTFTGNAPVYGSSSNLRYDGASTVGAEWTASPGSGTAGAGQPADVTANPGSFVNMPGTARSVARDLFTQATSSLSLHAPLHLYGNWADVSGAVTIFNSNTIHFRGGSNQSLSRAGAPSKGFYSLTIDKTAGSLTLLVPVTVQEQLTLTSGNIDTSTANLLTVNNTLPTGVSGGSAASYVNGPFARLLPSGLVTGSTYVLPIGKGNYNPLTLVNPTTTIGGDVRAEVFDANSGGTAGTGLGSLKTNRYWRMINNAGDITGLSTQVRLTDSTVGATDLVGYVLSGTPAATYNSIGGSVAGSEITSATQSMPFGFFNIGTPALVAPTVTAVNPTSGPTAGGNSVTITGTGFTGVTGVTFDGLACAPFNFVSDTEINCTAPAHAAGAVSVLVTTPGGTNAANTLYTYVAPATPTLGTYSATAADLSGNVTVTPSAAPANTTSATATTSTAFKGTLTVDPATGVVGVTNAHPAGTYTVTVHANGAGGTTTATFQLTVTATACAGTPWFLQLPSLAAGNSPNSVSVGDFNSDGRQDLAIISLGNGIAPGVIDVYLRNAANTAFVSEGTYTAGGLISRSSAVADFNGDGRLDLVVPNGSDDNVSIYYRNAAGTAFDPPVNIPVGDSPISVAAGDINGDGRYDIATVADNSDDLIVLLRNAANTGFDTESNGSMGTQPFTVVIADLNGSGNPDVAAANANLAGSATTRVRNVANTGFGSPINNPTLGDTTYSLTAGDLNGDGMQDLATGNYNSQDVSILLRNAANTAFVLEGSPIPLGRSPRGIQTGDFNGDGRLDLATANLNGNGVSILLRNAGNTGYDSGGVFATSVGPFGLAVADFNGDGKQDIVTANQLTDNASLLRGVCVVPDIRVTGNGQNIADGDPVPNLSNHTAFGLADVTSGSVTRTFTIENIGPDDLELTGTPLVSVVGTNAADFSVIAVPTSPVAPLGSTTFQVTFDPSSAGTRVAEISIANNDPDENPFNFAIQGTGTEPPTVTAVNPTSGTTLGGNSVTITGTGFTGVTGVTFDGLACTSVNFVSDTEINCTAPAHAAGTVSVIVTTPGGTNAANTLYTYVLATTTLANLTVPPSGLVGNSLNVSTVLNRTSAPAGPVAGEAVTFTFTSSTMVVTNVVGTTDGSGLATVAFTPTERGGYSVVANYAGSSTLAASTSNTESITVYQRTSLAFAGGSGAAGSPITLTATLTAVPSGAPIQGQFVQFNFGGTPSPLGAVTDASGVATVTPTFPTGGTFSTTASFSNVVFYFADSTGALVPTTATANVTVTGPPTLGTYPATTVDLSDNVTVTPSAAPTGTTSISVSAPTSFIGELTADPATGVVRITNAHLAKIPAGAYPITVKAFGPGGTTTATFNLTVTTTACGGTSGFNGTTDVSIGIATRSVAVGDFNGDGIQDIATANQSLNTVSIRLGDGLGGFTGSTNVSVGSNTFSVAVGDFNGDGKQDIAAANFSSNTVSIRLGDGSGGFTGTTEVNVGVAPASVAVGDFNGDGIQDIAAANANSGTVSIRLGDGSGGFAGTTDVSVGVGPTSVTVADFNVDGIQDIATANQSAGTLSIRLGDGFGGFTGTTEVSVGLNPWTVAVGDFNGDGKQDIAAANFSPDTVSIRLGNGSGGFTGTTNVSVGVDPISVAVGDFDGDGIQDIAAANRNSNTVSIRFGDGSGGFTGTTEVNVGTGQFSLAVGDFNGDGRQDLATANASTGANSVSIRLGSCSAPAPTVTSVNPTSGPTAGGTVVTITGTNFTGATAVSFGGTAATTFNVDSPTQITATAPMHATGAVSVDVTTPGGTNAPNTLYTYEAETTVAVDGLGNLTITDTNGGDSDDNIVIACTPPNITITDSGTGLNQTVPIINVTGSITVNTLGGIDTLTVDLSGCDFIPAGGLFFNGGETAPDDDALNIVGGNQGTVTYGYGPANGDGTVAMSNFGTITYTGLEPIVNNGTAADVIFNLPGAVVDQATLGDDGISGNGMSRLSAVSFEQTDFSNPSGSVTINRGVNTASLSVTSLPDLTSSLTIGSDPSRFNQISFNGLVSLGPGKNLTGFASSGIFFLPAPVANVSTTGAGAVSLTTARNFVFSAGTSLTTVDGPLTLSANQQVGSTSGNFAGIHVAGATVHSSGTGIVSLSGRGGDTSDGNFGIFLSAGAVVRGGNQVGVTTTDILGTGGSAGNLNRHGVDVDNSTVTSLGGDVRVRGFGGGGTGNDRYGVIPINNGIITSGGNGNVVVEGTGGATSGGNNVGVIPHQGNGRITSGGSGSVTVTGTGGPGSNSHGVQLFRNGTITSGGAGQVSVNGTGNTSSFGFFLNGSDATATVTSGGGPIVIDGTGGTGIATDNTSSTIGSGGNLNISLIADTINIGNNPFINAGIGTVNIRQRTNGRLIELGGADSTTQLGLLDTELDRVTAGTLNIGDANTGNVNVTGVISQTKTTNISTPVTTVVFGAGDLGIFGTVNNPISVNPGGTLRPGASPGVINNNTLLSLGAGANFAVEIGGPTPGNGPGFHDQANVTGVVDVTDANLSLAQFGGFVPTAGQQYVIINNDGADPIGGTFAGLSEGATIAPFLVPGMQATISYVGGDGNDVVLTAAAPTYSVIYDGNGNTSGTAPVDANSPYSDGSTVTVLGNTGNLAKTGFVFGGWNTQADGLGFNRPPGTTFTINANTTLFARWILPPTLGNYLDSSVDLSGNATITPDAVPTQTGSTSASTTPDFKGSLTTDLLTGVVRVTNAHPAGTYAVKVTAIGPGGTFSRTFALTVVASECGGASGFTVSTSGTGSGLGLYGLAIGDFNGDGQQDIATANRLTSNVTVLQRNPANTDFNLLGVFGVGSSPEANAVGDFNADGKQDIVAANSGFLADSVSILQRGVTTFSSAGTFSVGTSPRQPVSVAVGDFDGDGRHDLVTANSFPTVNAVSVLMRTGVSVPDFQPPVSLSVGVNPVSVSIGDFNGDGMQDIVTANNGGNNVSVLLRNTTNTGFDPAANFAVGNFPQGVTAADINGDGRMDIVTANSGGNDVSVLLRSTSVALAFEPVVNFSVGTGPVGVAVGDFNGDGKQDIATANQTGNNVSILLRNVGNTGFDPVVSYSLPSSPRSLVIGDFNADKMQDIAIGYATGNALSILSGTCTVADLSITKTDGSATEIPGTGVTYTITASNAGPSGAPGTTVADTFPPTITGVTWTCVGAAGGTCASAGSGNINDVVDLPAGGSVTYTATGTISASATGSLANTATVTAAVPAIDPASGNNSATDTDTLTPEADLAITKTDGVTTVQAGLTTVYTIVASNPGPSNVPGATVVDTFPAGISSATWTCAGAGGGTCTASGSSNINDTVNLPVGGSVTYTVTANIAISATGTLANTVTITAPGGLTDTVPGNNSATDTDTVTACIIDPTVLNNANDGPDSLRRSVAIACVGGTITFAPAVTPTITLTSGQITIDKSLTITGPGASLLAVSGNDQSRVFAVNTGATVNISRLTVTGGRVLATYGGGPVGGGGITNGGNLTLSEMSVSGNRIVPGLDGDSDEEDGGGIYNSGTLTISKSSINNNVLANSTSGSGSIALGGGIYNTVGASANISESSISGNSISGPSFGNSGGGIQNYGILLVTNSLISGNSVINPAGHAGGGGIASASLSSATLINSTISGNSTAGSVGGGGIYVVDGLTLINCTITGNSGNGGAGIRIDGTVNARNTIVSGNTGSNLGGNVGTFAISDHNIVGDEANINLGPLSNNGGPTLTHALLAGSSAINAGSDCVLDSSCAGFNAPFNLTTDQRGAPFARKVGSAVDVGAFEVPNLPPVITPPANQSGVNEGALTAIALGSFTDATMGPWSVVVNWGDGSTNTSFNQAAEGSLGTQNHIYQDNGTYTVSVTVTDSGGLSHSGTFTVAVANLPPTATLGNGGPYVFGQPGTVSFSGQSDPSPVDTTAGFRYSYDFDNNGSFEIGDGTYAGGVTNASAALPALPVGTRTVRGRIVDKDGGLNDYTTVVTVNKANTTTTLASSANPSVFGQSVTFTATISVVSPGAGTPTGTVTFRDNGVNIGTCAAQAVSGNAATCSISTLAIGTHPITAVYNGDGNFIGSTSNTISQVVDKGNTTTTVTAAPVSPSVFGQSVTFTATVAVVAPGAGTPTGTVSFNIDGNIYCANTPLNGSLQATCTQAGLPALPAGLRDVVAIYSGDTSFNGSTGDLNYTVNKANTATTITADNPDPSLVNQPYTVSWTVVANPVQVNSGTPTGTVTVNGGTGGGTCTAPVAAGGCQLTPTTPGVKSVTATYNGDANFNASPASGPVSHTVNVQITGTIRQAPAMTPIAGVVVTTSGACGSNTATTNSGGTFTLVFNGGFGSACTVTPQSGLFDPISRTYIVTDNITGADFVRYNSAADIPRTLSLPTQFVVPGASGSMPIMLDGQGNEAKLSFTVQYPTNAISGIPSFVCGPQAPGCTITQDTSVAGRVGLTIVPAGGVFSLTEGAEPEAPTAQKHVATMNFSFGVSGLPNAAISFVNSPVNLVTTDAANDPLLTRYIDGLIVAQQGTEGDLAGRNAGNGSFEAADVVQIRRFVAGLDTPALTHNEFQRADTAPASTRGDGVLTATDVVQTRRYVAALDTAQAAGGPGIPNAGPIAPPEPSRSNDEVTTVSAGKVLASAGSRVSVPVEMRANGREMALSFVVRYDAAKLGDASVELADPSSGAIVTVNTEEPGVIRVLVDSPVLFAAAAKGTPLVNVSFAISTKASMGDSRLVIERVTVSDLNARSLPVHTTDGGISIAGDMAPMAEIAGRVVTPDGAGLRNAVVSLIDGKGLVRTTTTAGLGYYRFGEVVPGETYTLKVESRRFQFDPQVVLPNGKVTVDIRAKE